MKKLIFVFAVAILFSQQLFAQEETLISGEVSHGGFGGPVVKFTQINGEFGVLVGGRGGWIINHTFVLGGGGYGLVNNIDANVILQSQVPLINFGYGGFEMEYIFHSDKILHFSFYTLIGAGTVTYRDRFNWNDFDFDFDYSNNTFFVIEPAANIELNVTDFFRINAGVGYRFISGIDFDNLDNSDFSGPSANITFKFGKF